MRDELADIERASSLAQIAQAVYDPSISETEDWKRIGKAELSELKLTNSFSKIDASGVVAGLYKNSQGEYALSFAGTDFSKPKDVIANLRQGLGLSSRQHSDSIKLSREVHEKLEGNLTVTGHSKGGGQAIIAGSVTGAQTVTFNPAGVHAKTFAREGLSKHSLDVVTTETKQIQNFVAKGEVLDKINGLPLTPTTIGAGIDLKSELLKTKLISGHSMKHVISLLAERKTDLLSERTLSEVIVQGIKNIEDPKRRAEATELAKEMSTKSAVRKNEGRRVADADSRPRSQERSGADNRRGDPDIEIDR